MALPQFAISEIEAELKANGFYFPGMVAKQVQDLIEDKRKGKYHPLGKLTVFNRLVDKYSADEYQEKEVPDVQCKPK